MSLDDGKPHWASKVPQGKIRRLYEMDAQGITDAEMIDDVGWALWNRCDSILTVTAAHHGHVLCPSCQAIIEYQDHGSQEHSSDDGLVSCSNCGWQILWSTYHQTYRGKQLYGANAVEIFRSYHDGFPKAQGSSAKMLLIDQLIHAFHISLTGIGRPVAANLIAGSLREVIRFLDRLTEGNASPSGSQVEWQNNLAAADWAKPFLNPNQDTVDIKLE